MDGGKRKERIWRGGDFLVWIEKREGEDLEGSDLEGSEGLSPYFVNIQISP